MQFITKNDIIDAFGKALEKLVKERINIQLGTAEVPELLKQMGLNDESIKNTFDSLRDKVESGYGKADFRYISSAKCWGCGVQLGEWHLNGCNISMRPLPL